MLHALERKGYLTSRTESAGCSQRRVYRATPYRVEALELARGKVLELFREVGTDNRNA